jgi:hypothetical protein
MAIGGIVSGGMNFKSNKTAQQQQRRASNDLTRRMETSQADYLARRPQAQQERAAALQTQLGLLKPANGLLGEMTGGRYALDFGAIPKQSPVSMKPLQSQLGNEWGGGYDRDTLRQLREQGYDIKGIPVGAANPKDTKYKPPAPVSSKPVTLRGGSKK